MIQNIINKELINENTKLNIIYDESENLQFNNFIKKLFINSSILNYDDSIYGMNNPHLVICNNRNTLLKTIEFCYFFHIPLLLIDHTVKNTTDTIDINLLSFYSIALSNKIYNSWNRIHNEVLNFDVYSEKSKSVWKNIIIKLCKTTFTIKEDTRE